VTRIVEAQYSSVSQRCGKHNMFGRREQHCKAGRVMIRHCPLAHACQSPRTETQSTRSIDAWRAQDVLADADSRLLEHQHGDGSSPVTHSFFQFFEAYPDCYYTGADAQFSLRLLSFLVSTAFDLSYLLLNCFLFALQGSSVPLRGDQRKAKLIIGVCAAMTSCRIDSIPSEVGNL
jgi:hypothetical protein